MKKKVLRGDALTNLMKINPEFSHDDTSGYMGQLDITKIQANPFQPRMYIDEDKLNELATSIKENGIIEPLIVSRAKNGMYEIVAGERRWRAAKLAKLTTVPVVVRDTSPQQMLELAIIENIQRADLNPLEEAYAFKQLHEKFGVTYTEIADKIGFSRPLVANKVRLLDLPDKAKNALLTGKLTEGHAKALLAIKDPATLEAIIDKTLKEELSVRQVEYITQRLNLTRLTGNKKRSHINDKRSTVIESSIKDHFKGSSGVQFRRTELGGYVKINFKTDEELDGLLRKMGIPFRIN
jgi:ParB family chromosome partitioning protein